MRGEKYHVTFPFLGICSLRSNQRNSDYILKRCTSITFVFILKCYFTFYSRDIITHSVLSKRYTHTQKKPLQYLLSPSCHIVELHHLLSKLLEAVGQVLFISGILHTLQGFLYLSHTRSREDSWVETFTKNDIVYS